MSQYRPSSALNPITPMNLLRTLPASFNSKDMTYSKPNDYGSAKWYCLCDGSKTQVGDYLVGDQGTFFIAAQQPMLPIMAIECNRVLNVYRQQTQSAAGINSYGGTTLQNRIPLMTGFPASVLKGAKAEKEGAVLVGDLKLPGWAILMPAVPGVVFLVSDIITDDIGRTYIISSPELTDMGWRLDTVQAQI